MLHFKHTIFLFGMRLGYLAIKEAQYSKFKKGAFLSKSNTFS